MPMCVRPRTRHQPAWMPQTHECPLYGSVAQPAEGSPGVRLGPQERGQAPSLGGFCLFSRCPLTSSLLGCFHHSPWEARFPLKLCRSRARMEGDCCDPEPRDVSSPQWCPRRRAGRRARGRRGIRQVPFTGLCSAKSWSSCCFPRAFLIVLGLEPPLPGANQDFTNGKPRSTGLQQLVADVDPRVMVALGGGVGSH